MKSAREWLKQTLSIDFFDRVFTSPMHRARESARIVAGERGPIVEIGDFAEVDFGLFEGLTAEEIQERYPNHFAEWNRERLSPNFTYAGGENRGDFAARVQRGALRMLAALEEHRERISPASLLVAHRGVIRAVTTMLIGAAPAIEIGSIQVLRAQTQARWTPELLDVTEHLGPAT
jgi:broad specificity phosphatase PhoE